MRRCPVEEAEILSLFARRLRERPASGFVVAFSEVVSGGDSVDVQVSDVACSPLQLVALAHELLNAASERIQARPDARDWLDLLCMISRAQVALDFTLPADAH